MGTERGLDEVLDDLVATRAELDAATDLQDRAVLRDRLTQLRAEAAAIRGPTETNLSDDQLAAAIRSAERALDELRSARLDPSQVGGASGYGGGLDPMQTARHNQRVDRAGGRSELQTELDALLRERTRRTAS